MRRILALLAILFACLASLVGAEPSVTLPGGGSPIGQPSTCTDGQVIKCSGNVTTWGTDSGGAGSAILLDFLDDGANESLGLTEIATIGANTIFTEPAPDKLVINTTQPWPNATSAATALDLNCTGCIVNSEIAAGAGITESKLALNNPTHSNANDPSPAEKQALAGTFGPVSTSNPYVTLQGIRTADSLANAFKLGSATVQASLYVDATDGFTIDSGVVAAILLDAKAGQSIQLKTNGTTRLSVDGTSNDVVVSGSSYAHLREGAGAPLAGDCDAVGEAGRTYVQTDAADTCKLWVCGGTAGWKNQCGLNTLCWRGENVNANDDNRLFASPGKAVQLLTTWCHYEGSAPTTIAQFSLSGMTHTPPVCAGPAAAATPQVIGGTVAERTVAAYTPFRFSVANTPNPATDTYLLCVGY